MPVEGRGRDSRRHHCTTDEEQRKPLVKRCIDGAPDPPADRLSGGVLLFATPKNKDHHRLALRPINVNGTVVIGATCIDFC